MTGASWLGVTARALLLAGLLVGVSACGGDDDGGSTQTCDLPAPFCGGDFPLNTLQTTEYGPAWADVRTGSDDWAACFGPYALCYYANCTPSPDGVADCPCYDWFGTSYVLLTAILNLDAYNETQAFCSENPGVCLGVPNSAPVCEYINSGQFMSGAARISTFSTYRAAVEPIGSTDCSNDPGVYAGCMTAPCFGPITTDPDGHTATLSCDCPTFDGPYQVGKSGLTCDDEPLAWSAAYNPNGAPSNPCDIVAGCIPDAPADQCGCPLYVPGETTLPPNSGIDCNEVCQQYASCTGNAGVELGYTCDASLCTSEDRAIVLPACNGLQNCDLSEVFAAERAAGCSCCATQLCGCDANPQTDAAVAAVNAAQRANGETPQCDVNGTLCGVPQEP